MVSYATAIMTEGPAWDGQWGHQGPLHFGQSWHLPRTLYLGWSKPRAALRRLCPSLGLGHADVWDSTSPSPQKQTPDEMWLCVWA